MIAGVRTIRVLSLALVGMALTVAAARAGALRYFIDSEPPGSGSDVVLDFNPSTLTSAAETPDSFALFLPAHWRFDHRAVARECSPAQAAAVRCPAEARIGYGHAVVHAEGYLFPGGETDGVVYITPFLGQPERPGDRASIVLEVQLLGLDPLINAANQYLRTKLTPTYSIVGRLTTLATGPYGFEATFGGFPGAVTVPAQLQQQGVSASVTTFKLLVGAVRRVVKRTYDVVNAPTASGGTQKLRISDREMIGYHLLRKAATCPSDRQFPYQIEVSFPSGDKRLSGVMPCR
jgi:hypothetical protein